MNWLTSILVAFVTAIIGMIFVGFVTSVYADWGGYNGSIGVVIYGIVGIVSFFFGLIVAAIVASGFWRALAWSICNLLVLAAVFLLVAYLFAHIPPTLEGDELNLEVEIRLPVDHATSPKDMPGVKNFTLSSESFYARRASQDGELLVDEARLEDGRWVVPAKAPVFTSRGRRVIDARIGEAALAEFIVPLPARPGHEFEQWSRWLPQPADGSPWPDTKSSHRFRVKRIPPPPPPPTQAEHDARQEAEAQAAFDALAADTSLSTWLTYTAYGSNEKRRDATIQRLIVRPNFAIELGALMLDANPREAEAALRVVDLLPSPGADLLAKVTAAGRDLIVRIKAANAAKPEQDPGYEAFADCSIRFSAWMVATRALRERAHGDFTPELHEILELSRLRTDSHVMQQDIRRVASYHLKQWAGVEPLPGDPPPR